MHNVRSSQKFCRTLLDCLGIGGIEAYSVTAKALENTGCEGQNVHAHARIASPFGERLESIGR